MKKIFLMCAFAGFTFAASAQTEPTAAAKTTKKEECTKTCTPEEKAACTKMVSKGTCCASGKATGTAMAAKTEKAAATTKKAATTSGNR